MLRAVGTDGRVAYSEVPLFAGLSQEDAPGFEEMLSMACRNPLATITNAPCSSIAFGFEDLLESLRHTESSAWLRGEEGIAINGLVWMGDKATMRRRIADKLAQGFRVLKLKIGGICFDDELDLLAAVRAQFGTDDLEIRLDANGSFAPDEALDKLGRLSEFGIHSLEQPIKAGNPEAMAAICRQSPIDIALDEELIGMRSFDEKKALVDAIHPAYLVLKPALCGGFAAADEYISIAGDGRWWATSALESNLGLFAIGRWLSHYSTRLPQGLGTGQLYSDNIASPLEMRGAALWCDPAGGWQQLDGLPWRQ